MAAPTSVHKSLERIKATVEAGSYYEAQQMYKTVFHRHKARRQLEDSYTVLHVGAVTQLHNNQLTCGIELGLLLLEAYATDKVGADAPKVQMVLDILKALPSSPSTSEASTQPQQQPEDAAALEEPSRFVLAAAKWCQRSGATADAREIHSCFAVHIWRTYGLRGLGRATLHFIRGSDMRAFAEAVHQASLQGPTEEADLWLLRGVLQILGTANRATLSQQLQAAQEFRVALTEVHQFVKAPAVNLSELLLVAFEQKSLDMVRLLKDKYSATLRRDESLGAYLGKAEQAFLNVRPAGSSGLGGLLGGLLRGLTELEGQEEEDEEEAEDA